VEISEVYRRWLVWSESFGWIYVNKYVKPPTKSIQMQKNDGHISNKNRGTPYPIDWGFYHIPVNPRIQIKMIPARNFFQKTMEADIGEDSQTHEFLCALWQASL